MRKFGVCVPKENGAHASLCGTRLGEEYQRSGMNSLARG
jgi:hypothetical protein